MNKIEIESPYPSHLVRALYSPQEVVQYKQEHVLWLLGHMQELRGGHYPGIDEPMEHANFLICLELEGRLKKCGLDGLILLVQESLNMFSTDLGDYLNLPDTEIIKRAETALLYVSGEECKPITYQEFKHLMELADKQLKNSKIKGEE